MQNCQWLLFDADGTIFDYDRAEGADLRQVFQLIGVAFDTGAREQLSLWGGDKTRLPEWFQKRFPSRYTARNLFSSKLPKQFGLQPLPETPDGVLVSVPERALLEMLSEVGLHQGIEEARNIMEGARALRTEVLTTLLKNCQRVRVQRFSVRWAEELGLPWAPAAKKATETQAEHFLKVLENGSISTNIYLRRIHNFALDMNWLPWPVLPKKRWPAIKFKEKRGITCEEHQAIVARELNPERKAFYQLAWHLGAAQSETADGVIQVLGSRRSRLSTHDANSLQNIPRHVVGYIHAVARQNGEDPQTLERDVIEFLERCGVLSPAQIAVLFAERLCLVRPEKQFFACPQCRRVDLHRSGGICIDCLQPLNPPQPLNAAPIDADYYNFLATRAGDVFRLNCEELTGQTNKAEARNRQRLIQGICLPRLSSPDFPERRVGDDAGWRCRVSGWRRRGRKSTGVERLGGTAARRARRSSRGAARTADFDKWILQLRLFAGNNGEDRVRALDEQC